MTGYCVNGNEHSAWRVQNIFASRETVILGMTERRLPVGNAGWLQAVVGRCTCMVGVLVW